MNKEEFDILADKYLKNTASPGERRVLEEYLSRLSKKDPGDLSGADISEITKVVYGRISAEIEKDQAPVIPLYKRPVYKIATAAAIILVIGLSSLWLINKKEPIEQPVATQPTIKDVLPGSDKAILTLADGTTIVLDSASGTIANEGGVALINQDGKISYQLTANSQQPVVYNTITTPRAGQYQLVLADGTKVWLDAESSIRFPNVFNGSERRVELTGQGYFEVAHNSKMPFHVSVANMDVQVLGTHFNINSYSNEEAIKTTLLEGSVRITTGNEQPAANSEKRTAKSLILSPGQQALYRANSQQLTANSSVDIDQVMAWKNGFFSFDNADLKEVMKQISRWYDVEVVYKAESKERFAGKIDRNLTLSQVLKGLADTKVKYQIEGKRLIIL